MEGDTVIFFVSPKDLTPLVVNKAAVHRNKLGTFRHDDMIGKQYGTRVTSIDGTKKVALLRPSAELWTRCLPHRTQILYLPDISFILRKLDILPGKIVIESGTGSGSFSHSVTRALWPNGRLLTFEFHQTRAETAAKEFSAHGLDSIITLKHQNVIEQGFDIVDEADAIFLDLPSPWEAIGHAKAAIKKTGEGRICCYSPCIEQVLRTFEALRANGFVDIEMFELLSRDHEVRVVDEQGQLQTDRKRTASVAECRLVTIPGIEARGHTSFLTFARYPIILP